MEKLLSMLSEYLAAAQIALTKYGPQVWEVTLALVRANAIFHLALMFILCIGGAALLWLAKHWCYKGRTKNNDYYFGATSAAITGFICIVSFLAQLFSSFEYWLGAFYPEGALLYAIAQKAGIL